MPKKVSWLQEHLTVEQQRLVKELAKVPPHETVQDQELRLDNIMLYMSRPVKEGETENDVRERKKKDCQTRSNYKRKGDPAHQEAQRKSSAVSLFILII